MLDIAESISKVDSLNEKQARTYRSLARWLAQVSNEISFFGTVRITSCVNTKYLKKVSEYSSSWEEGHNPIGGIFSGLLKSVARGVSALFQIASDEDEILDPFRADREDYYEKEVIPAYTDKDCKARSESLTVSDAVLKRGSNMKISVMQLDALMVSVQQELDIMLKYVRPSPVPDFGLPFFRDNPRVLP
jgi:hypothetical protein